MKRFLLMTMLLAALAGCSPKEPATTAPAPRPGATQPSTALSREELVKKTIERYNVLLAEGYKNLNMNPLQEVATVRLAEKAYTHMAAIGEGKARMISSQKKIDFLEVRFPKDDQAAVRTREIWDFAYLDIKSGKLNEEVKDFPYDVNYTLEMKDGRWVITDIAASSERDAKENMKGRPRPGQGGER